MLKTLIETGALSSSRFRWFYCGRTVSLFGRAMTPVALAFAVLQARNGQQLLGYILAAEILPNVLMLLIGGNIADRYRRDRILLLCNLGSGLSQTGIAAIVLMGANSYLIFPLAISNGVLAAFTSPAMRGIIPEIVDSKDIKQANSLLNTSSSAAKIVGPTIAGVLVATVGGGWGIAIDAVSFFISALCLTRVHIPSRPSMTDSSLLQQMREGWAYFRHRRWIWSITAGFALMNAVQMGVWQVLGPIMAENTFGSAGWGLTLGVKSVGLLVASVAMLRFELRRPLRDSMLAVAVSGIPMIVLGQGYALPYLLIATAFAGAGQTISGIGWDTTLQQAVPKDKLSRVCAFDDFGSYAAIPVGEILAVPLAEIFGYQTVATVGGLVFIVVALLPLLEPQVRRVTTENIQSLNV
ncbi:MAG: MFS transporter [Alicyclobacillus macrosporangiidus]|uniref:MFS transporter n=1 Tax=Alicyclobacillus macrosporangiidus TaxID=392015 RepID=UPI0026EAFF99|nr:MFS transporter [Alicyclobacillus macrosporangiidus]MCL6599852.1 MFS transporter [Alicyclobacillus macrosporangiidus]